MKVVQNTILYNTRLQSFVSTNIIDVYIFTYIYTKTFMSISKIPNTFKITYTFKL